MLQNARVTIFAISELLRKTNRGGEVTRLGLKNTHKEHASSNKTKTLIKSITMDVWVIGALDLLFLRSS